MYPYGLIGNCLASALVSNLGSIDWLCLPRPDSAPVFGRLLDKNGGSFSVEAEGVVRSEQNYIPNTNILITRIYLRDNSIFQITDFSPRFEQFGRMFQPLSLHRIIEPVQGNSLITVRCNPISGWDKHPVPFIRGNSHLRYDIRGEYLRVLTNMPLTHLTEETTFSLLEPVYFGLTWNTGLEDDLIKVTHDFLERTIRYWRLWVKHCSIPTLFQKETIRSALALKLHCYNDTGAIFAALSTSLPEQWADSRNWDYRYSWLRDAYFVLSAFHQLGQFEEMEQFVTFLLNIVNRDCETIGRLAPVYKLDFTLPLPELEHSHWEGYENSRPVRSGNQAAEHIQNDVYGEMVLALSPIFLDERFYHMRSKECEYLLFRLGQFCMKSVSQPDAGPWEFRSGWREHSFSNLMCWAGLRQLIEVHRRGYIQQFDIATLAQSKKNAEMTLRSAVIDGSLRNGPQDPSVDAALALLPLVRYEDVTLSINTIEAILKELPFNKHPSFFYRYKRKDDFGQPASSFIVCSFWLAEALARLGRVEQAQHIFTDVLKSQNHLGLLSEHYDPAHQVQLGNFPQAYAHVGLINAAFAVSPPWHQVL